MDQSDFTSRVTPRLSPSTRRNHPSRWLQLPRMRFSGLLASLGLFALRAALRLARGFLRPLLAAALGSDDRRGSGKLLLANDDKRARSRRRSHHPPRVHRDAPAVAPQSGPFEWSRQRYGKRGSIGTAQDAPARFEAAPLTGLREVVKVHGTAPGMPTLSWVSLVPLPTAGIVSTGPSTKRRRSSATRACCARSRASSADRSVAPS